MDFKQRSRWESPIFLRMLKDADTLEAELAAMAYGDKVEAFRASYAEWGAWIIIGKGLTPIPYKLVTITSGFADYSLFWFIVLSIITRGVRFFALAGLLRWFGPTIKDTLDRHLGLAAGGFAVAVVGGFVAFRYLF